MAAARGPPAESAYPLALGLEEVRAMSVTTLIQGGRGG